MQCVLQMGRDSRERKTLGGKGSVQVASRLFQTRLLDLKVWKKRDQVCSVPPDGRSELPNDSILPLLSRACSHCQSTGTFCRWQQQSRQCQGKGWSEKNPQRVMVLVLHLPCQSWLREGKTLVKGLKVSRLLGQNSASRGPFFCTPHQPSSLSQTFPEHLLCARYVLEVSTIAFYKKCAI